MHRHLKRYSMLRRVLFAGAFLLVCPWAAAQPSAQIVVTGAREALSAQQLVADVVVIDAARIAAAGADSIEELLRREAGVQVSRAGGPGASAGLLIRGANSGHTLVLVDGVRIGSATSGLAEFEGLGLANIERIEVLRGPASSLYGADAVGGVVQIFTKRGGAASEMAARFAIGGFGAREAALSGSGKLGAVDIAAAVSQEQNKGVSALRPGDLFGNFNADRDGFARSGGQVQLGYTPAQGQRLSWVAQTSRLNAQYDGSEFAPPNYAQNAGPDFRNRLAMHSMALTHNAIWSPLWSTQLRLSDQESDANAGGLFIDRFRTTRRTGEAQATWAAGAGQQLTLALDHLVEKAQSSSYLSNVERRNQGAVLAYSGQLGDASAQALSVQADVRHDNNSLFGGVNTGRVGAALALNSSWRLRALWGSTFKAPSLNDVYYPGYGVASIQPEHGRSLEVGLNGRWAGANLGATLYRNEVRNLIGYEPDRKFCPAGFAYDFGCARNIGRARLQGASLNGDTLLGAWRFRAVVDFLDAKDALTGARLTRRAAHQETLGADWRSGALSVGAELLRVGARPEGGRTLAGYAVLDLKARWQVDAHWQLEAKLLNATDRDYQPALDYRPLGRQAWLGARWAH